MAEFEGMNLFGGSQTEESDIDTDFLNQDDDFEVEVAEDESTQPEDTETAQPDDNDDDEIPGEFTGKFRKRLEREAKGKKAAREEAEQARREAEQLRQELEQERQLRQQAYQYTAKAELAGIDAEIEKAKREFIQFRTDYDVDPEKELALQDRLTDLKARKRELENGQPQRQEPPPQPAAPKVTDAASKWLDRNPWFNSPQYAAQAAAARTIDQVLAKEGLNPGSDAYFNELDRRLKATGIKLPTSERSNKQDPVQAVRDVPAGKKGMVTLTRDDLQTMRSIGLSPENPAHLKAFAQEKRKAGA